MAQISLLTPSGIHLGFGSATALKRDPLATNLVERGRAIVEKLMAQKRIKALDY